MNALMAWFKSKNITSHTIALAAISAAGLITSDEQVRSFLVGAFAHHPKIATEIIAVAGIILKYTRASSPVGAEKEVVADVVNDPNATAVIAANVKPTPKEPA